MPAKKEHARWLVAQLLLALAAVVSFGIAAAGTSGALVEEEERPAEATWQDLRVGPVPQPILDLELRPRAAGTDVSIEARGTHGTLVIDGGPSRHVGLHFEVTGGSRSQTLVLRQQDGTQWTVWSQGQPRVTTPGYPAGTVHAPPGEYDLLGWTAGGTTERIGVKVAIVRFDDPALALEGRDVGTIAAFGAGAGALGLSAAIRWSDVTRERIRAGFSWMASFRRA